MSHGLGRRNHIAGALNHGIMRRTASVGLVPAENQNCRTVRCFRQLSCADLYRPQCAATFASISGEADRWKCSSPYPVAPGLARRFNPVEQRWRDHCFVPTDRPETPVAEGGPDSARSHSRPHQRRKITFRKSAHLATRIGRFVPAFRREADRLLSGERGANRLSLRRSRVGCGLADSRQESSKTALSQHAGTALILD